MRWIGHRLYADVELDVTPTITLADAHRVAHEAQHTLTHVMPKLDTAVVHAYPAHTEAAVPGAVGT
jgi:divalent metal cation (Fe/Co/Zn/Cd) transporter